MNRFLYAEANPATLIDPDGHSAIVEDGVIVRPGQSYRELAKRVRHGSRTKTDIERDVEMRYSHHGGQSRSTHTNRSAAPTSVLREAIRADERFPGGGRDTWLRLEAHQQAEFHRAEAMGPSQCGQNPLICVGFLGLGFGLVAAPVGAAAAAGSGAVVDTAATAAAAGTGGLTGLCVAFCNSVNNFLQDIASGFGGAQRPAFAGALSYGSEAASLESAAARFESVAAQGGRAAESGAFYRGALPGEQVSFALKPGEYRLTGVGQVRGLSVFNNAEALNARGMKPFEIERSTVSSALSIEQRGANMEHFEIVPAGGEFPPEDVFQELLNAIRVLGGD